MGDVGGPILSRISMRRIGEGYLVQNFLSMHMYVSIATLKRESEKYSFHSE